MKCTHCGTINRMDDNYCKKCGSPLTGMEYTSTQYSNSSNSNRNVIIICATIIIITIIIAATLLLSSNVITPSEDDTPSVQSTTDLKVNTATFYSDGNPNTGETVTINVGKEHAGEQVETMTQYSRGGSSLNNPSGYEKHVVDSQGEIILTDYTPMPRYPDYCRITIRYNNRVSIYGCDIGTYKGTQTSVPKLIS